MSCDRGSILRKGYVRKAFMRKDGTWVPSTKVAASCIRDQGKPGHGPKTLPALNDDMSLTRFGYAVHSSDTNRHRALREASDVYGTLPVLRRLNLVRNYSAPVDNKATLSRDVKYMSALHASRKRQEGGIQGPVYYESMQLNIFLEIHPIGDIDEDDAERLAGEPVDVDSTVGLYINGDLAGLAIIDEGQVVYRPECFDFIGTMRDAMGRFVIAK